MAQMKLNEEIRNAVSEAVIFSARTEGSPLTRNRLLLSYEDGELKVTAAGVANSAFTRRAAILPPPTTSARLPDRSTKTGKKG